VQAQKARDSDLIPIDEVARRLGVRASAIRYYEERGLVQPVSRHSGRRWYGQAAATRGWAQIVQERIEALRLQAERMNAAREYLEHVLAHHRDSPPDGCLHYESLIFQPPSDNSQGRVADQQAQPPRSTRPALPPASPTGRAAP